MSGSGYGKPGPIGMSSRRRASCPSSDTFINRELGVTPVESSSRVLCLPGRSMGKKASKGDVKAVHSQGLWPREPEDQFILAKIKKLLKNALYAADIWEAMEYLMAARGLLSSLRQENTRCE